jgi:hypothetical protein
VDGNALAGGDYRRRRVMPDPTLDNGPQPGAYMTEAGED